MSHEMITVTLTYPDGACVSFDGVGAVVYTSDNAERRLFAVTGMLTLGDVTQLINELMDAFGDEAILLTASLALVARRMHDDALCAD